MKPRLAIMALFAFSSSAFALIGEDAKQIEARYGKPMQVLTDRGDYREVGYAYRGFMLIVKSWAASVKVKDLCALTSRCYHQTL